MGVVEDIIIAKDKIMEKKTPEVLFTDSSFIYKSTNENIRDENYVSLLNNKPSILSIIGSGDQILNSILYGSHNIDAFDISRFPKYFLDLKIAAIMSLDYREYLSLFYDKNAFSKRLFRKVVFNMNGNSRLFWDCIVDYEYFFQKNDQPSPRKVYNSSLFVPDCDTREMAIKNNPYLDRANYYKLKAKISDVTIRYFDGNIVDLVGRLEKSYDLVNLSNICMYQSNFSLIFSEIKDDKFKRMIKNFKLNPNGKVLNYLMCYIPGSISYGYVDRFFKKDSDFSISIVKNENSFDDALVTYTKAK